MVIAFRHMSSVRCGVPREDSLHLAVRDPACTTWKSVAGEKDGLKGARYARIAAGDLRPCPRPFPQPLCSAMSSMHRCCTSELKRRMFTSSLVVTKVFASEPFTSPCALRCGIATQLGLFC
jgi:hypothetical protein